MPESFFNKVAGKETLAQVFSCEFCEISENTFSHRTPRWLLQKETLAQVFRCEFCEISKDTFSHRARPVAAFELLCKTSLNLQKNPWDVPPVFDIADVANLRVLPQMTIQKKLFPHYKIKI